MSEEKMGREELVKIITEAARAGKTELDLSGRGITELPEEIGQLTSLTTLYLFNNQLRELPKDIWQLTRLRELRLYENQLTELPKEIGQLTNLTGLFLFSNQLTELPKEIGQLTSLTELGLALNRLTELPKEIGQLTRLTGLGLGGNRLTELPKEIGQPTRLTSLYLDHNQLTDLPKEIGQLTSLTRLYLGDNQLTELRAEVGKLEELEELTLEGNPLESPPPEIVEQGTKAVLAYLREMEEGAKKRYEGKLIILGDGGEGKTCVSRALRKLPFERPKPTTGVDIVQWRFAHPGDRKDREKKITLNIWDFEGQEINHQTHRFFLTEEALYLLVFKGRERFDRENIEYWLDTIRNRAPESEVILVATECEEREPQVDVDALRSKYPKLLSKGKCFFAVGCANRRGVSELRRHIRRRAARLRVMGKRWPESFARAEGWLENRAEKDECITRGSLHGMFRKGGVNKGSYETAAERMGQLGIITHFPRSEALRDFVVLKPQWLTKAISYVLEDGQLKRDQGEITHERMHALWEERFKGLSGNLHQCMKEFELSYDLEYRNKHLSLVPLRFGFKGAKKIPWSKIPGAKRRTVEYRFDTTPPFGLMSRFIVKVHPMIVASREKPKGVYWHNGVFVRDERGKAGRRSEALCVYSREKRTLNFEVRAAHPQNMVDKLNTFAEAVFDFFEGLEPELFYGCVKGEANDERQCRGYHSELRVIGELDVGNRMYCEFEKHYVEPPNLLFGIYPRLMLTRGQVREAAKAGAREAVEEIRRDVMLVLVNVEKIADEAVRSRVEAKELSVKTWHRVDQAKREMLALMDEMLDNREFNSAPGVVGIGLLMGEKLSPGNWFNQKYILTPYCEFEGAIHRCTDASVVFKMPRVWWEKTAPKLALGLRLLSTGLKIGFAGLPLKVDEELFEAMKDEVGLMKELAGLIKLEGGAESDVGVDAGEFLRGKGAGMLDVLDERGADVNRIARMQLAQLLGEIAPKNYKARKWGSLQRVRMRDNSYRWMCQEHAKEYKD